MSQNATEYSPTKLEEKLLEIMLQPENRYKTVSEICRMAEIDRSTYYRAFAKAEFMAHYKAECRRMVDRAIGPVLNAFVKQAVAGSFQHGKVLLEMGGLIGPDGDDDDTPPPTKVVIGVQDARKPKAHDGD